MENRQLIERIRKEKSEYQHSGQAVDLANSLETLADDIYSEGDRFVYELIQNADDAAMPDQDDLEVRIEFTENFIVISHNGKPFDETDIYAISSVGQSSKTGVSGKTGYKGIGFKSVFGKSDSVYISSNGFVFSFDKDSWKESPYKMPWQIIPNWVGADYPNELNDTLFDKYPVSTAIRFNPSRNFTPSLILEDIRGLLAKREVILFLRSVSQVTLEGYETLSKQSEAIYQGRIPGSKEVSVQKVSIDNDDTGSTWLIVSHAGISIDNAVRDSFFKDQRIPKRLKDARITTISFAMALDDEEDMVGIEDRSIVFTYLPTKVSMGLPFLVNADFVANASREGFHEDILWNQWLFREVGYRSISSLGVLARTEFKNVFGPVIPSRLTGAGKLIESFNKGLLQALDNEAFVPGKTARLLKVSEAWNDSTGIGELVGEQHLLSHLNVSLGRNLFPYGRLSDDLKRLECFYKVGVIHFDVRSLGVFMHSHFFSEVHKFSDALSLIKFVYDRCTSGDDADAWEEELEHLDFIYDQEQCLVSLHDGVHIPMDDFMHDGDFKLHFIHDDLYQQLESKPELMNWLRNHGVGEPSPSMVIKHSIIPKLGVLSATSDGSVDIVRYLFTHRMHIEDYSALSPLKLVTDKGSLIKLSSAYLSDFYQPTFALQGLAVDLDIFVSRSYYMAPEKLLEWKLFWLDLGVADDILVVNECVSDSYYDRKTNVGYLKSSMTHDAVDKGYIEYAIADYRVVLGKEGDFIIYQLYKLRFLEYASRVHEFSKLFWSSIFSKLLKELSIYHAVFKNHPKPYLPKGYFSGWHELMHYNEWAVRNLSVFPASTGELLRCDQLYLNTDLNVLVGGDFLPVLDLSIGLNGSFVQRFDIFSFRRDIELNDLLHVLTKLSDGGDLVYGEISDVTIRVEAIYFSLFNFLAPTYVADIGSWAVKNKLLSRGNSFEPCSGLYYLDLEGFEMPSGVFQYVKSTAKLRADSRFVLILRRFGVRVVDHESIRCSYGSELDSTALIDFLKVRSVFIAALDSFRFGVDIASRHNEMLELIVSDNIRVVEFIDLVCESDGVELFRSARYANVDSDVLFCSGKWTSFVASYDLSFQLCRFLGLKHLERELMVLLYGSLDDCLNWVSDRQLPRDVLEYIESWVHIPSVPDDGPLGRGPNKGGPIKPPLAVPSAPLGVQISSTPLNEDDRMDVNLFALYKALRYFKSQENADVSNAEAMFDETRVKYYLEGVVVDGRTFDVMCRSAHGGSLFVTNDMLRYLRRPNYLLFVSTGASDIAFVIFKSVEELHEQAGKDYFFKVHPVDKERVSERLLDPEDEIYDQPSWIIPVRGSNFDPGFLERISDTGPGGSEDMVTGDGHIY